MTIASSIRSAGPYTTNGIQTVFPFGFKVFAAADLVVTKIIVATGVASTLALTTNYTVALNANQDVSPGGTITTTSALSGAKLVITSNMVIEQPAVFTNQGGFYPRVLNDSLDRRAINEQQLDERLGRALLLPPGETTAALPPAASRAGKFLAFGSAGEIRLTEFQPAPTPTPTGAALRGFVTPEDYGAIAFPGINNRAAIQAAIDACTGTGIICRLRSTYDAWVTQRTTTKFVYADDGHLLVIKGSITIEGVNGATINRKGLDGVAGSQQFLGTTFNGYEGYWRGGGLYWSHSGSIDQNTRVVLRNFKLDGGLNKGTPGGAVEPAPQGDGWDTTDKGIFVGGIRSGTLIMEDMEICRFRGELNYWAGQSDLISTDKLYMSRCWIHTSDGDANNAQGGYAEFHQCKFGDAYAADESLGRSGHKYFDCEFYDALSGVGVSFLGGPDPDFDGIHGYSYPIRRVAYVPWTELNNCYFRNCGGILIGNWVRGNITCVDSVLQIGGGSDVNITADMWLDSPTGINNVACIFDGQSSNNTNTAGYVGTPSHVHMRINCYRTKQAADAGKIWAAVYNLKGGMIPDTCSFNSEYAEANTLWGPYGPAVNMVTIPASYCEQLHSTAAVLGASSDGPTTSATTYTPTWPALVVQPTVQTVVTLSDTYSGHQFFYDDGFRVTFYKNGGAGSMVFPVGGAFTRLKKPRTLINNDDFLELVWVSAISKFVERRFVGQESVPFALTDAATIAVNMGCGFDFEATLAGNRTLGNPTNASGGQKGTIRVTQDGTGARTLAYGSAWKFPGGAPTLTITAGAVDVITYEVGSNGNVYCTIDKAFA